MSDQDGGDAEYTATVAIVALPATALAVGAASGTYGGTTALTATLTAASQPLAGQSVAFTLGGTPVGSATSDASGVAALPSVSLAGIAAAPIPAVWRASRARRCLRGRSGSAALTVAQAPLTITADEKSRLVGAANPTFTATYTGFVGNERRRGARPAPPRRPASARSAPTRSPAPATPPPTTPSPTNPAP